MSKAFWEGFWDGFGRASKYGLVFLLGVWFGYYFLYPYFLYPYEQCKRMYETPEDISECVWIKENP